MLSKGEFFATKTSDSLFMKWLEHLEIFNDAVRWLSSKERKQMKECFETKQHMKEIQKRKDKKQNAPRGSLRRRENLLIASGAGYASTC